MATFTDVAYAASADKETFTLRADDEATAPDIPAVSSASVTSEVTASRLVFSVQPNPRAAFSAESLSFAPALTVAAVDAAGAVDTDYTGSVVISETGGAGNVVLSFAADTDADPTTASMPAVAGVAIFSGLSSVYTATSEGAESYFLAANSGAFAEVRSEALTSSEPPPPPPPPDPVIREKVDKTGKTTVDPEVGEGGELTGGEVCGDAVSAGTITDVTLCPKATITGGTIGGEITGDPEEPAKLSGVTVLPGSRLSNVDIGADVILLRGVIIGDNVSFA